MDNAREVVAVIRSDYPEPLWIQAATLIHDQIDDGVLKAGRPAAAGARAVPAARHQPGHAAQGAQPAGRRRGAERLARPGLVRGQERGAAASGPAPWSRSPRPRPGWAWSRSPRCCAPRPRPASFDEAEELSIAPGTDLFHLDRVRLLDEMPIALDSDADPAVRAARDRQGRLHQGLPVLDAGRGRDRAVRADTTMEAREADADGGPVPAHRGGQAAAGHAPARRATRPSGRCSASTIKYAGERYRLRTSFSRPQSLGRRG